MRKQRDNDKTKTKQKTFSSIESVKAVQLSNGSSGSMVRRTSGKGMSTRVLRPQPRSLVFIGTMTQIMKSTLSSKDLWYVNQSLETPATVTGLHRDNVRIEPKLKWAVAAAVACRTTWRMTFVHNHTIEAVGVYTAWVIVCWSTATFRPIIHHQTWPTDVTDCLIHLPTKHTGRWKCIYWLASQLIIIEKYMLRIVHHVQSLSNELQVTVWLQCT